MIRNRYLASLITVMCAFVSCAFGTDRFYRDITTKSPSGRYMIEAKSPDNAKKEGRRAFQDEFVYTFKDTTTNKVLWTREQEMSEPKAYGNDPKLRSFSIEPSPVAIFVSDDGWTVIRTAYDDLISVGLDGIDRGSFDVMKAFTEEETRLYVHHSTAGPMWAGYSHWYFADVGDQHLFVVRPWWGRRIVMDIQSGMQIDETEVIAIAAAANEQEFVVTELAKAVASRSLWEPEYSKLIWPILQAAFLAGQAGAKEAIPYLEQLQDSSYSGGSKMTLGSLMPNPEDEDVEDIGSVNPYNYTMFTLRQVVHLSLRRLGVTPKEVPLTIFRVEYNDRKKNHYYLREQNTAPRAANADLVKKNMTPENVVDLVGSPDYVVWRDWEYDMDCDESFTLSLTWDKGKVRSIRHITPARWENGLVRDAHIVD